MLAVHASFVQTVRLVRECRLACQQNKRTWLLPFEEELSPLLALLKEGVPDIITHSPARKELQVVRTAVLNALVAKEVVEAMSRGECNFDVPINVPIVFLLCSYRVPIVFLLCSYCVPIVFLSCSYRVPIVGLDSRRICCHWWFHCRWSQRRCRWTSATATLGSTATVSNHRSFDFEFCLASLDHCAAGQCGVGCTFACGAAHRGWMYVGQCPIERR
jgi:hypothetical protein